MQRSETQTDNVVSIFARRENTEEKKASKKDGSDEESFGDIMERNAKNSERMRRERNNANKSVLKSYRIKH